MKHRRRNFNPALVALLFAAAFSAAQSRANSFVGNGGSQGDIELQIALQQTEESFAAIAKREKTNVKFCECNPAFSGRAVCDALNSLTPEQMNYCSQSLFKVTPQILDLLRNRKSVRFNWTNSSIEVKEGADLRTVDAVADRKARSVTINQSRFLGMQPAERVFLLAHELMHFTDLEGKPLEDQGEAGPFKGEQGSRSLLNAMASSTAILQGDYPEEIKSHKTDLNRSQAWKKYWVSLDMGSATAQSDYSDKFQFNRLTRTGFSVRYQLDKWGLIGSVRGEHGEKTVLDTIQVKEDVSFIGAGVSYRWFPFSDPMTFWGQSHVVAQGMVEYFRAEYKFSEDPLSDGHTATGIGANVGVSYYVPVIWGLWGYAGVGYEFHPYSHVNKVYNTDVKLDYNTNLLSSWIGVSYAF